ncbi:MAG: ABC transporter substrate binding protein, partial [Lachnospiraceae bacterium]
MDELRALGYDEAKLEFVCKDAGGSMTALNHILSSFQDEGVDLIVPLVTSATQAAVNADGNIPIVFISVTDPVSAGIMSDLNMPDKNATGSCNVVPIDTLFELAQRLTPGIETVGILYDLSLPNSVLTVERAKAYFEEKGIDYMERTITNSSEVQTATQVLAG